MTALARLGLGTVQFGLDYGVSNRGGRPPEQEAAAILARAAAAGVGFIDTAPAYGAAETLVGRHLPRGHNVRIITKAPALADATIDARHGRQVLDGLAASLDRLKVSSVHGFLVHQSDDLAKPGWQHLADAMHEAHARGWANRIGASVYNSDQLALVESRFHPQLVQLPLNVLDRRAIISGILARLKSAGVEIHARSVFLQGLLLMEPDALPEFFVPLRQTIARLRETWQQRGLSALGGCLAFVLRQPAIDAVIVGVNRMSEFAQIEAMMSSLTGDEADIAVNPPVDAAFLDPSRWPDFVH